MADPLTLIGKNIKVTGTAVGTRNDVRMALQFAAQASSAISYRSQLTGIQGHIKPVIEQFPFAKIADAVQKLKSGKVAGRCVVRFDD